MAKVITMGEIMLRLSTPGHEKFIQADEFDVSMAAAKQMLQFHLQTTAMMLHL